MRIKYAKLITFFIIISNILIVYYTWKYFISINLFNSNKTTVISNNNNLNNNNQELSIQIKLPSTTPRNPKNRIQTTNKHIKKSVTIVFREIYSFDNDIKSSIDSIINLIPSIKIFLIFNSQPYPPILLSNQSAKFHANVKIINLECDVEKKFTDLNPINLIRTKFVLFMPDGVRLNSRALVTKIIREFNAEKLHQQSQEKQKNLDGPWKIVAVPFSSNSRTVANCARINLDSANWTIEFVIANGTDNCDMVKLDFFFSNRRA